MLDTKAYLEIQFKGYPVGKKVRCHIWIKGRVEEERLKEDLKNHLNLFGAFKEEQVHKIKIFNLYLTNSKKDNESYNELIVDSEVDAINLNMLNHNVKESKKIKNEEFKPATIKLVDMKDDDLVKLHERMSEEILRRRYSLTEKEYAFYKDNETDINIWDAKELYKKFDGDIIKLRKQKIREKISNL